MISGMGTPQGYGAESVAFLLTQLGTHAAARFADRVAALDLNPPQAGILRAIALEPGRSQQALSGQLSLLPSRVVAFIDDLEKRGYVERRRHPTDRRLHALYLTPDGERVLAEIGQAARAHENEITEGLTPEQRAELTALLRALASQHGLAPGVHPGYRALGRAADSARELPAQP
jgi:DNA-binding MarR family transcriptional regulator